MGIALSGVFSGIDTESIVSQLMAVARRPLTNLLAKSTLYEARRSAVEGLGSKLEQFKLLVEALRGTENLRRVIPASSDTDVVTVSAGGGASEGVHDIIVDQLATGQRLVHTAGLAELTSTVGAAKSTALNVNGVADPDSTTWFTTGGNGATYTFDFGDEDDITGVEFAASTSYSMNEVAALINARSQAVGEYDAATVEYDSQQEKYFLRLSAKESSTTGTLTQTRTAGDEIAEINDNLDWNKTAAGAGALVYTYDGVVRTINVTSSTTLENLRDLINNDGQNPGVTASILEYNDTYHLVLSGQETGEDHTITVDNFHTTLNGFDAGDFTVSQQAQNARFRVDGYPPGPDWMERSSNTIADVLPGVTLTLKSAGTATVTLSRNLDGLRQNLEGLVAAYNDLVDNIDEYVGYDEENETRGLLQGDGVVSGLLTGTRNVLISAVDGFVEGDDSFMLPGLIGLEFDKEGHLALDEAVFSAAVSEDYLGVLALVGSLNAGASDSDYIGFFSAQDDTEPGVYEVEVDFDAQGMVTAARIRVEGEANWRPLTVIDNELTGADGNAEQGLVLAAAWDGSSTTQTATVRVKRGFAGAIHDELEGLLDSVDGAVKLKTDQFDSSIEQVEANIESAERRLEAEEERLRAKFARLEMLLAGYASRSSAAGLLLNQVQTFGSNYYGD